MKTSSTHHVGTPRRYFNRPLIDWLKFYPVPFTPKSVPDGDPTQDEIATRAEEVRNGWTPAQRRVREREFTRPSVFVRTVATPSRRCVGGDFE